MTDESEKPLGPVSLQKLIERYGVLSVVKEARDLNSVSKRSPPRDTALDRGRIEVAGLGIARKKLKNERLKAENKRLKENNKDQRKNREMRFSYSKWVFGYLVCYSIFVGALLVFAGFNIWCFKLDPSVLNFLVGSTAVSSIGLVAAVVAGLFSRPSK